MHHLLQRFWDEIGQLFINFPIPLPVVALVSVYVSFSLLYPILQDRIKEDSRGERWFRVFFYSIIMLFTGYFGRSEIKRYVNKPFHIGKVDIPIFLDWFVLIAIAFAVIQVLITLLSMNLHQGILPDSLKPVSRSKQGMEKLTVEYQVARRFTEVAADWTSKDVRNLLREMRLIYQDNLTFLRETCALYMNLVSETLGDDGISVDYELLSLRYRSFRTTFVTAVAALNQN